MTTVEEYLMAKLSQALFPERLLTRKITEKGLVTRLHTIHKLMVLWLTSFYYRSNCHKYLLRYEDPLLQGTVERAKGGSTHTIFYNLCVTQEVAEVLERCRRMLLSQIKNYIVT